jgi:hypothetical protein
MQDAIQHDPTFNPRNGAFDVPAYHGMGDVFDKLPLELRLQVVSYLPSSNIANLRLSSRAFRQLPIFLWRDLLLTEMPWLWEVWSDEAPYIWAITTHGVVVAHEKTEEEIQVWHNHARTVIKQEMPEIFDYWDADVQQMLSKRVGVLEAARADALSKMVTGLPVTNTNWYKLYTDITRNWKDLKGLQNRKRIWSDIERIVRRLEKYT